MIVKLFRKFCLAWNFLTCLSICPGGTPPHPTGCGGKLDPEELSRSMAFFPLVGLAIAIIPAIFILISYQFLTPLPPHQNFRCGGLLGSLAVIFIFSIETGGLHLDGLADTVDGLYGGKNKKEILDIMRDNHVGSMGVIALIFVISFKIALLNEIWMKADKSNLLKAVFLVPAMSRWSMVSAAWLLPYARSGEGLGETFAKKVKVKEWLISTFFIVLIAVLILKLYAFLYLPVAFLAALFLIKYFNRRIGGATGDVFGFINEAIEIFSLGIYLLIKF